jgi:hypothetical protein
MLTRANGEDEMTSETKGWTASRWIALILLLWTLAGITAFIMQWTQDLDALAKTDPYQAETFRNMPGWAWAAYGVAVVSGLLGALLLVLSRKGAVILSGIEVVAVIVQFSYTFGMTELMSVKGPSTAIFPAVILVLAVFQLLLARHMTRTGQLR